MRVPSVLVAVAMALAAQEAPGPLGPEADLVLLQPYLGSRPLGEGIEAYRVGHRTLVPLGELCRLLAFGIRVDLPGRRAEGFYVSESRRFLLDLAAGVVEAGGRRVALGAGEAVCLERDLYVEAQSLAAWFPLKVRVDLKASSLNLLPLERLPLQDGWEREGRFGGDVRRYGDGPAETGVVALNTPYTFLDVPMLDLNATANRSQGRSQVAGAASLAGDFLWMGASAFASRDADGQWRNLRGTLFREDPAGGLLGPLQARRVALGDLMVTPSLELAGGLPLGRGLSVDNLPVAYRSRFAVRTFRGALPEGWSVEFFQNNGLVGFQRSRADGLYEFPDVPLRFGLNQFRLVFHGPQGQTREEVQRLDISQEQVPPGTFYYSLAAVVPTGESAYAMEGGQVQPRRTAWLASTEYGLTGGLSLQAGAARVYQTDGPHSYGTFGLQGILPFLGVQVVGAQDQGPGPQPGRAAMAVVRTGIGYSSLALRHAEYRGGFSGTGYGAGRMGGSASWLEGTGKPLRSLSGVDLQASLDWLGLPMTGSLAAEAGRYLDGTTALTQRVQGGAQVMGFSATGTLVRTRLSDGRRPPAEGGLMLSRFWGTFSCLGDASFQREAGQVRLKAWGLSSDWRGEGGYQVRLGLRGQPGGGAPLGLLTLGKLSGRFGLGLDVQKSRDVFQVGLRLQVSVAREPRSGGIVTDALAMTGQGAVSARAFEDRNGNGRLDPGERVLEGTRFRTNGGRASDTGDPRITFLTQVPRGQEVDIALDASSLEDAAQQPTVKAFRIVPRPGKVARVDIPVNTFGEVTGTTRIRREGKTSELSGLEVELCKATGERVQVLRSSYDGYFEFRNLPHGEYLLRVTAEDVARVRLKTLAPRRLVIDEHRNLLDGLDLVVEPLGAPPAKASDAPSSAPPPPVPVSSRSVP